MSDFEVKNSSHPILDSLEPKHRELIEGFLSNNNLSTEGFYQRLAYFLDPNSVDDSGSQFVGLSEAANLSSVGGKINSEVYALVIRLRIEQIKRGMTDKRTDWRNRVDLAGQRFLLERALDPRTTAPWEGGGMHF